MTESSSFPPEIYDLIIDQLGESKSSLSAAALVGRTWLPRCRLHLFRHVTLDLKQPAPASQTQRAVEFEQHVSCNKAVASYTRELSLTLSDDDDIEAPIPANTSITNLRTLRLKCSHLTVCCLKDTKMSRVLSFIRRNHDLQNLSIHSLFIELSPLNALFACIAIRASSLRRLVLHDIWSPDWTSWSSGDISITFPTERKARCLEELCIMECDAGVVSPLLRTVDMSSLRSLALLGLTIEGCVAVLRACSSKVTHLTLDLSIDPRSITDLVAQNHLFQQLTDITVLQLVLTQFSDVPPLLQNLLLSTTRYHRQTLKHLHLEFQRSPYPEDLFLDSFLFGICAAIPSLQRISIRIRYYEAQRCKYGSVWKPHEVIKLFPQMAQTGLLSFRQWDSWWEKYDKVHAS